MWVYGFLNPCVNPVILPIIWNTGWPYLYWNRLSTGLQICSPSVNPVIYDPNEVEVARCLVSLWFPDPRVFHVSHGVDIWFLSDFVMGRLISGRSITGDSIFIYNKQTDRRTTKQIKIKAFKIMINKAT